MSMLPPLAVAVAPNGARRTKADHPALPMTAGEIAGEAARCAERGASMIHLHVRDGEGRHSLDADLYREAISAIRREAGSALIIQVTTEAVGRYHPIEQMAVIRELRPEAASVALKELIPDEAAEGQAADFHRWALAAGLGLQHILYSASDVSRLIDLTKRGIVPDDRLHGLFVLGRYTAGQRSDPFALLDFLNVWPERHPWSLCAFGQAETASLAAAAALGGHVRVGFENSIIRPDGSPAVSNAEAVARVSTLAVAMGRPIATPREARAIYRIDDTVH